MSKNAAVFSFAHAAAKESFATGLEEIVYFPIFPTLSNQEVPHGQVHPQAQIGCSLMGKIFTWASSHWLYLRVVSLPVFLATAVPGEASHAARWLLAKLWRDGFSTALLILDMSKWCRWRLRRQFALICGCPDEFGSQWWEDAVECWCRALSRRDTWKFLFFQHLSFQFPFCFEVLLCWRQQFSWSNAARICSPCWGSLVERKCQQQDPGQHGESQWKGIKLSKGRFSDDWPNQWIHDSDHVFVRVQPITRSQSGQYQFMSLWSRLPAQYVATFGRNNRICFENVASILSFEERCLEAEGRAQRSTARAPLTPRCAQTTVASPLMSRKLKMHWVRNSSFVACVCRLSRRYRYQIKSFVVPLLRESVWGDLIILMISVGEMEEKRGKRKVNHCGKGYSRLHNDERMLIKQVIMTTVKYAHKMCIFVSVIRK